MAGSRARYVAAAAVCLALVVGGQALASRTAPAPVLSTRAVAARAGFAYLSGIRTFGAAVLWNRLETLLHGYYDGVKLEDSLYAIPSIRLVNVLDPQLEDAYAVGSWIIAKRGEVDEGIDIARTGAEQNPDSGHLWTNYAQILEFFGKDRQRALDALDHAREASWRNPSDNWTDLQTMRVLYEESGRTEDAAAVLRAVEELEGRYPGGFPDEGHDHDGDGRPDHSAQEHSETP